MKICAVICEYNPFHNGHKKQLEMAKKLSECDFLVCVMSGNFVQRGEPAVTDKFSRARYALENGADAVIELPFCAASGSADDFAFGAMRILKAINAEYLSFGCECGNAEILENAAELLERKDVNDEVKRLLKEGKSYPSAFHTALNSFGCDILEKPNDTLALSYIRQGRLMGYSPEIVAVKRQGDYGEKDTVDNENPSATSIRNAFENGNDFSYAVPQAVFCDAQNWLCSKIYEDFALRYLSLAEKESLSHIYGMIEGLENRITDCRETGSFDEFMASLKTKRYTYNRLKRLILHSIVGLDNETMEIWRKEEPYSHLLGVKNCAVKELMPRLAAVCGKTPCEKVEKLEKRADRFYYSLTGVRKKNYPVKV